MIYESFCDRPPPPQIDLFSQRPQAWILINPATVLQPPLRGITYPPPPPLQISKESVGVNMNSQYSDIIRDHSRITNRSDIGRFFLQKSEMSRKASNPCPKVPTPYLSPTSFDLNYYVNPSVKPGDVYGGLECIWNEHFKSLFTLFDPHKWYFGPTSEDLSLMKWKIFRDFGKVRFLCKNCNHGWTSMHGMVMFYYKFEAQTFNGQVRFLLTGQACTSCDSSNFETPMWYPEEAQKVMTNLYYTIARCIYNYDTPSIITLRRHGRPRQQHIASQCEGCRLGICKPPPYDQMNCVSDNKSSLQCYLKCDKKQ